MYHYLILDDLGAVIGSGSTNHEVNIPANGIPVAQEDIPRPEDILKKYVSDGQILDRPTVPAPQGYSYDLTQLPEGSSVIVSNEANDTETFTDLTEPLELESNGRYRVSVVVPFPYIGWEGVIDA